MQASFEQKEEKSHLSEYDDSVDLTEEEEQRSATMSECDVEQIVDPVGTRVDKYVTRVKQEQNVSDFDSFCVASSAAFERDYESYGRAVAVLKKGVRATKLNFSNEGSREVVVFLSSDERYLRYEPLEKTWRDYLNPLKRVVPIAYMKGLLYGGLTTRFLEYSRRINLLKEQERSKMNRE